MKRIVAFILLALHLFTAGGYFFVFEYFIHQCDLQLVKEIYDNKVDKKLIELKIPVHLPHIQSWNHFEHVEGQVILKDTFYNYVRMKITRDTLDLLCIPNNAKTQLQRANLILAKEFSDVPVGKKSHGTSIKRALELQCSFLSAYNYRNIPAIVRKVYRYFNLNPPNPYLKTAGQPPDFRC